MPSPTTSSPTSTTPARQPSPLCAGPTPTAIPTSSQVERTAAQSQSRPKSPLASERVSPRAGSLAPRSQRSTSLPRETDSASETSDGPDPILQAVLDLPLHAQQLLQITLLQPHAEVDLDHFCRVFPRLRPEAMAAKQALQGAGMLEGNRLTESARQAGQAAVPAPMRQALQGLEEVIRGRPISVRSPAPKSVDDLIQTLKNLAVVTEGKLDSASVRRFIVGHTEAELNQARDALREAKLLNEQGRLREDVIEASRHEMPAKLLSLLQDMAYPRDRFRSRSSPGRMDPGLKKPPPHLLPKVYFRNIAAPDAIEMANYTHSGSGFNSRLRNAARGDGDLSHDDLSKKYALERTVDRSNNGQIKTLYRGIQSRQNGRYINCFEPDVEHAHPVDMFRLGKRYGDAALQSNTLLRPMADNLARAGDFNPERRGDGVLLTRRTRQAGDVHDLTKTYEEQEELEHVLKTCTALITRVRWKEDGVHQILDTDPVTVGELEGRESRSSGEISPSRSVHSEAPLSRLEKASRPADAELAALALEMAETVLWMRRASSVQLADRLGDEIVTRWCEARAAKPDRWGRNRGSSHSLALSPEKFLALHGIPDRTFALAERLTQLPVDVQNDPQARRTAARSLGAQLRFAQPSDEPMTPAVRARFQEAMRRPKAGDVAWDLMRIWLPVPAAS